MPTRGIPVPLDRTIPFVARVVAVMEGRGAIDDAVDVLLDEERRTGVGIWRESRESALTGGYTQRAACLAGHGIAGGSVRAWASTHVRIALTPCIGHASAQRLAQVSVS